jgi:soluble lytic murein transglycosylase-like protein
MKLLLRIAGIGLLVLATSAFMLDGQASADDGSSCARTNVFIPRLCISLPLGTNVKREGAVQLSAAVTLPADVRIESGEPAPDDIGPAMESVRVVPQYQAHEPEVAPEPAPVAPIVFDQADLRAYARAAAIRQGIDANLFVRQINAESAFDPYAVSTAGAVGIAQIMPALHPAVDPTDPYASLDYAARLMRGYIIHFGDWRRALVAYNAGPGRLMPGNPHYLPLATILSDSFGGGETKRYVARILGR